MKEMNGKITEYNEAFILQRADPYVYRHENGMYYFTASVPEFDKVILRCADTLEGLKEANEKTIWVKHDTGLMSKHIWAPEIHYLEGAWYIYFAAGQMEDEWEIRPYVLKCSGNNPMTDSWEECGQMQAADGDEASFTGFSLDATVFENKGRNYYVWAEKPVGEEPPISNLYIAPMESPTKLLSKPKLLTTPEFPWERVEFLVNEGPAVVKHDGTIFLSFSASGTGACYCMGLMSISEDADVMDMAAWKKRSHPVFVTNIEKGIYGPGHNSFTKDEKGNDICVFHARTYEKIEGNTLYDPNRHAMLLRVKWEENGEPVFEKEANR